MPYQFLNEPLDETALRNHARRVVGQMAIIQGAERGDARAYGAMLSGWWYYVTGFEKAISRRMISMLPLGPLTQRYGDERARAFRRAALKEVSAMHQDEGSHAAMWAIDARREGFPLPPLDASCPTINRLLSRLVLGDPVSFWCQLAATEFIAECLTERLYNSPAFMSRFFPSGKWPWGEAHLIHDGEISHREMDLDIALSYAANVVVVYDHVGACLDLFAMGSREVSERYQVS